jgi:hypothetical protein
METHEETGSTLKGLVKKVIKDHRGKEYSGKAYKKLVDDAEDIAEEIKNEIQKGNLKKENVDEKAVNALIQYYAVDHGIELDKKLSWHSCRI